MFTVSRFREPNQLRAPVQRVQLLTNHLKLRYTAPETLLTYQLADNDNPERAIGSTMNPRARPLGTTILPSAASMATPDPFGTGTADAGYMGDDQWFAYCTPYPWPSAIGDTFVAAMTQLDAQTDVTGIYHSQCTDEPDFGGYLGRSPELALGPNVLGAYLCTDIVNGRCNRASIVLNDAVATTVAQRKKTMCHEVGHGVGLTHGGTYGTDCMISGYSNNFGYNSHHVGHINAAY